jgi:hypothetical protein
MTEFSFLTNVKRRKFAPGMNFQPGAELSYKAGLFLILKAVVVKLPEDSF